MPPYSKSKSVFFNILYPASGNEFSTYENNIFFVGAILLLIEIISADSGRKDQKQIYTKNRVQELHDKKV